MKKVSLLFTLAAALMLASCGNTEEKPENAEVKETAGEAAKAEPTSESYNVNAETSSIAWVGTKLGKYDHKGNIAIKSGEFSVTDGKLMAGKFVIDMSAITNTDIEDEAERGKLVGHLSAPDFFDVAKYPEASFEITKVEPHEGENGINHKISGNLTMKEITKEISFPAAVNMAGGQIDANAEFTVNRTDWGITFMSGSLADAVKDNIISDEIGLTISLVASK